MALNVIAQRAVEDAQRMFRAAVEKRHAENAGVVAVVAERGVVGERAVELAAPQSRDVVALFAERSALDDDAKRLPAFIGG